VVGGLEWAEAVHGGGEGYGSIVGVRGLLNAAGLVKGLLSPEQATSVECGTNRGQG